MVKKTEEKESKVGAKREPVEMDILDKPSQVRSVILEKAQAKEEKED
ncbi:MAG: hypothetical protein KAV25_07535 [Methanophagales archaeon]|nr:hypothetical protein [Methanophagales archaeon]